jgi:hypothetical protein
MATLLLLAGLALAQDAPAADAPPEASAETTAEEGSSRMVFDDRLVRGEAAGGAVAITQRPPRALPPLVAERVSFLAWTVEPVLGARLEEEEASPATDSESPRTPEAARDTRPRRTAPAPEVGPTAPADTPADTPADRGNR